MITIKTDNEIELLRQGGRILGQIMKRLIGEIKPGVTTDHVEEMANFLIGQAGGRPSFKGYQADKNDKPFPTALCVCVNNEVVHAPALPSRELKSGDLITIDLGMEYPAYVKVTAGKSLPAPIGSDVAHTSAGAAESGETSGRRG